MKDRAVLNEVRDARIAAFLGERRTEHVPLLRTGPAETV
jgi:hypothetical protein